MLRLIISLCLLAVLVACSSARYLVPREFEPVAYMVEDLAHGTERNVDALIAETASEGQLAVAGWLRSQIRNDNVTGYPAQIENRRQRWPLLRSGLRGGQIIAHPSGKLRLAEGLDRDERRVYAQAVSTENRDRDKCDSILISISGLDPISRKCADFTQTMRLVRHRLDTELQQ